MFLESKYTRATQLDALTVGVGFKQRHTPKRLRGGGARGILRMVKQVLCRLRVPPALGAITSAEGQKLHSTWVRFEPAEAHPADPSAEEKLRSRGPTI